ncbi:hypothetical protein JB92DRAFT_3051417 [Gautieria morchelliformis]|nr:hypothetical protein JB92DRAFT_3051417 [Gautieria morchelliformis]
MVISLFSQLDSSRESTEAQSFVSFRPATLSTLMMLVDYVMTDETASETTAPIKRLTPLGVLNQNHCRLLAWGLTIPWCWKIWGNGTNHHFDIVTQITVTWLHHFGAWKLGYNPLNHLHVRRSSSGY